MADAPSDRQRLYKSLARRLAAELEAGHFPVGTRLPTERELALTYNVSRPTVREAIIALEVQGFVEVRVGSGTYARALPGGDHRIGFDVSAIELTEARLLIEAETAALAAAQITAGELDELERLIRRMAADDLDAATAEKADRAFHLGIASATRNNALIEAVQRLWQLRRTSTEAALLHEKARTANIKPVVEEHMAILDALKARDPRAARAAMRAHLVQVLDSLLFATEERAVEEVRQAVRAKRDRYTRATQ